ITKTMNFEKTEDGNVRCVEISGVVAINIEGLTSDSWIIEIVNLGSGVATPFTGTTEPGF
ncbi:hypothetical protein HK099_008715, partial [Clydaea vesicula]